MLRIAPFSNKLPTLYNKGLGRLEGLPASFIAFLLLDFEFKDADGQREFFSRYLIGGYEGN